MWYIATTKWNEELPMLILWGRAEYSRPHLSFGQHQLIRVHLVRDVGCSKTKVLHEFKGLTMFVDVLLGKSAILTVAHSGQIWTSSPGGK